MGVEGTFGTYICVAAAYQGRDYVQDVTVTTRDGLPGTLRAFVGDYRGSKANVGSVKRADLAHIRW
ncbi:hypothetical protein [Streptomyces sp. NPDC047725]|uniref:hypothetical protein n=1 Tax=Streptomyces sp. NPDC047725 TaxID=3365487 RepID=UPI003718C89E